MVATSQPNRGRQGVPTTTTRALCLLESRGQQREGGSLYHWLLRIIYLWTYDYRKTKKNYGFEFSYDQCQLKIWDILHQYINDCRNSHKNPGLRIIYDQSYRDMALRTTVYQETLGDQDFVLQQPTPIHLEETKTFSAQEGVSFENNILIVIFAQRILSFEHQQNQKHWSP